MIEKLRQGLTGLAKRCVIDPSRTPSAVVLPVFLKRGEYHILFVRRTETVKQHKGQISFPGGRYENFDLTLLQTALRETYEEIGIPSDRIIILGELDDYVTLNSNFIVSAFVGQIPYPYDFKIEPNEIARLIMVPIALLLDESYQQEDPELFKGLPKPVYHFGNDIIWGATARILTQFLEVWKTVSNGHVIQAEKKPEILNPKS